MPRCHASLPRTPLCGTPNAFTAPPPQLHEPTGPFAPLPAAMSYAAPQQQPSRRSGARNNNNNNNNNSGSGNKAQDREWNRLRFCRRSAGAQQQPSGSASDAWELESSVSSSNSSYGVTPSVSMGSSGRIDDAPPLPSFMLARAPVAAPVAPIAAPRAFVSPLAEVAIKAAMRSQIQ
jgi:hypothetical protein